MTKLGASSHLSIPTITQFINTTLILYTVIMLILILKAVISYKVTVVLNHNLYLIPDFLT